VGPISSTQPNPSQSENFGPTNQPNPQANRTPHYNRQQKFGHKENHLDTLFHRNIMAVSETTNTAIVSCIPLSNYKRNTQRVLEFLPHEIVLRPV